MTIPSKRFANIYFSSKPHFIHNETNEY